MVAETLILQVGNQLSLFSGASNFLVPFSQGPGYGQNANISTSLFTQTLAGYNAPNHGLQAYVQPNQNYTRKCCFSGHFKAVQIRPTPLGRVTTQADCRTVQHEALSWLPCIIICTLFGQTRDQLISDFVALFQESHFHLNKSPKIDWQHKCSGNSSQTHQYMLRKDWERPNPACTSPCD
jgi:hypothetical protein